MLNRYNSKDGLQDQELKRESIFKYKNPDDIHIRDLKKQKRQLYDSIIHNKRFVNKQLFQPLNRNSTITKQ